MHKQHVARGRLRLWNVALPADS